MKRIVLIIGLISLMTLAGVAQVRDISLNVAPTVEYTFWDNNLILNDGPFIGGRLGFGLGKFMEIRGLYMKSMDLKGVVSDIEAELGNISFIDQNFVNDNSLARKIAEQKVDITRWGGELKANIGLGRLSPYVLIGSGVQKFNYNSGFIGDTVIQQDHKYKEEQIYVNAGLGLKINFTDRMVLTLEGRNTMFNVNPENIYVKRGLTEDKRTYNWSAAAALEIYLGGRNPNEMTELDKAYLNTFTDGFRGAKFVVEPGAKFLNFKENSYFADTYMLGGSAGVDITDFIGLRAFYYQATKDKKLSLNFDNQLKMYGGNFIARLNYSTGFVPFVTLGGGYLDVKEGYQMVQNADNTQRKAEGAGFAFGGLGLDIPLADFVLAYGSASALLTTQRDVNIENVTAPSELKKHMMYDFGLKFKIGARQKDPKKILSERKQAILDKHQQELDEVRSNYEKKIDELNSQLEEAYEKGDIETAVKLMDEKKKTEKSIESVDKMKGVETDGKDVIHLRGEELENLVKEVLKEMGQYQEKEQYKGNIQERIDMLEELFLQMNAMPNHYYNQTSPSIETPEKPVEQKKTPANDEMNKEMLKMLEKLNKQLEKNNKLIEAKTQVQQPSTVIVDPQIAAKPVIEGESVVVNPEDKARAVSTLVYNGLSLYTGPSFTKDGDFSWNVGARAHYDFSNSNFNFIPEFFIGFGEQTGFGLSANATYSLKIKKVQFIDPYIGAGIGLINSSGNTHFGTNLILGTALNIFEGNLYIDYTIRGMFRDNQLAVGYRFTF